MMKRGLVVFALVNVAVVILLGVAMVALQDKLGQMAGLILLPAVIVPFIMAYVGHAVSGAAGNPFRGLIWGQTWWYFAGWLLALVGAGLVLAVTLGLGLAGWDMGMQDYLRMAAAQAAKSGAGELPPEAVKMMGMTGLITSITAPTIGAWFGGAIACLGSFAWLGWFTRRMMAYGRTTAMWTLVILYAVTACVGGFATNPGDESFSAIPMAMRILIAAFTGVAAVPLVMWLFLRSRSAVLPALVTASYQAAFAGAMVFLSDRVAWLAPPTGILVGIGQLIFGLALWLWKDPGGMDLAVAAVAFDGTPLTPEQAKALQIEANTPQAAPEGTATSD